MRYWKYKAYDGDGDHTQGVISGDHPYQLILSLRQAGLQVYDLLSITKIEYERSCAVEGRLQRLFRLRALASTQRPQPDIVPQEDEIPAAHWALHRALSRRYPIWPWLIIILSALIAILAAFQR